MKIWLKVTLFALTVLIGSVGLVTAMTTPQPTETVIAKPAVQDRPLLELINELRAEKGVNPLTLSLALNKSSQEKADDMATQHYFSHDNPQGIRGTKIIPKYLPSATLGSENLAICGENNNNTGAFELWMNSPAHYQGMIDPRVTLYGEGKAWDDEKKCMIYVNHFAAV